MINWSKDKNTRTIQIQTTIQLLGFEIPTTEEQMKAWGNAFEEYPYELNPNSVDFQKAWNKRDDPQRKLINTVAI